MEGTTEKVDKVETVIDFYNNEIAELKSDLECLVEDFQDTSVYYNSKDIGVEILNTAKKLKNRENIIEQLIKLKK
jgi:CII-binding regulator of phage lambda lysogenization HflD